jgi:hypothetical protein
MKYWRYLIFLLLLSDACVDPIDVSLPNRPAPLVVDGMITDEPGPYQVKLFYATPLGGTLSKAQPETGASVFIASDRNETEQLFEKSPGIYETSTFGIRGQVGVSYQVVIITKTGKKYESDMQLMKSAGTIQQAYTEFEEDAVISLDISDDAPSLTEYDDAFNLYVDAVASQNDSEPDFLRWRVTGTYEVLTFPQLNRQATPGGFVPDPLPCSGYIRQGLAIRKIAECVCCECWQTEYSTSSVISDNSNEDDVEFTKVHLGKIPATTMRFFKRYHVEIEQLSVSKELHYFWKLVQTQQSATSNIFQPNAVKIRGNVWCSTDPEEEVLGIFSVSAITRVTMFIEPSDIPYPVAPIDTLTVDCRDFANSTTTKPPFW